MLPFIVVLLVVALLVETTLYRRRAAHLRSQLRQACLELDADSAVIGALLNDNAELDDLVCSTAASLYVSDGLRAAAERRIETLYHSLVEVHETVVNLENSCVVLSDELDAYSVANAQRVLEGTVVESTSRNGFTSIPLDEV